MFFVSFCLHSSLFVFSFCVNLSNLFPLSQRLSYHLTHLCFFCLILMLLVCLIPLSLFNNFLLIFVSFLSGLKTSLIFLSYLCFSHLDVSTLVLASSCVILYNVFPLSCLFSSGLISSQHPLLVSCFETSIRFSSCFFCVISISCLISSNFDASLLIILCHFILI